MSFAALVKYLLGRVGIRSTQKSPEKQLPEAPAASSRSKSWIRELRSPALTKIDATSARCAFDSASQRMQAKQFELAGSAFVRAAAMHLALQDYTLAQQAILLGGICFESAGLEEKSLGLMEAGAAIISDATHADLKLRYTMCYNFVIKAASKFPADALEWAGRGAMLASTDPVPNTTVAPVLYELYGALLALEAQRLGDTERMNEAVRWLKAGKDMKDAVSS